MAKYELRIPKLGESVIEATVTTWLKNVGDTIQEDEGVLEVATDKVDTEIPCEVSGTLVERLVEVDEVAKVGQVVAIIETDGDITNSDDDTDEIENLRLTIDEETIKEASNIENSINESLSSEITNSGDREYSPLVRRIAKVEGISQQVLDSIKGTGLHGRVTKDDMLNYLKNKSQDNTSAQKTESIPTTPPTQVQQVVPGKADEIIPMSRMGKLIADHMVMSVQTSAHVQSLIEIDVTRVVKWRERNKNKFLQQHGEKLTYTPIFMRAVAQTIQKYPMVNISVDGHNIVKKNNINLGMAAALPDENLIVPVIKNADHLSLVGMAKRVNDLANRARQNKLSPDDIQDGTYTVTNVGSFGSITGMPIINQPQVAILALGAIRKMPAVLESPEGDLIAIRHMMIVSHSYDHRVINGALGGKFILQLKEIIENFNEADL